MVLSFSRKHAWRVNGGFDFLLCRSKTLYRSSHNMDIVIRRFNNRNLTIQSIANLVILTTMMMTMWMMRTRMCPICPVPPPCHLLHPCSKVTAPLLPRNGKAAFYHSGIRQRFPEMGQQKLQLVPSSGRMVTSKTMEFKSRSYPLNAKSL